MGAHGYHIGSRRRDGKGGFRHRHKEPGGGIQDSPGRQPHIILSCYNPFRRKAEGPDPAVQVVPYGDEIKVDLLGLAVRAGLAIINQNPGSPVIQGLRSQSAVYGTDAAA